LSKDLQHVDAHRLEYEIQYDEDDDRTDAETTARATHSTTWEAEATTAAAQGSLAARRATLVLDIVGLSTSLPFHDLAPRPR
jgi:hypothetical protein